MRGAVPSILHTSSFLLLNYAQGQFERYVNIITFTLSLVLGLIRYLGVSAKTPRVSCLADACFMSGQSNPSFMGSDWFETLQSQHSSSAVYCSSDFKRTLSELPAIWKSLSLIWYWFIGRCWSVGVKSDYGPSIKFLININLPVKTILRRQQDERCNLSILATEEYFRRPAGKGTRGRERPLKDTCFSGSVYQNRGRDSV